MVTAHDDENKESRPPTVRDLLALCQAMNQAGAKYIVIGGMAMIQAGYVRATEDIDILVDSSNENQERIRAAMMKLPDQAVRDVRADDLEQYAVVRVADEIVVDLMKSACGIPYEEAKECIVVATIEGIAIPFASPELLWRTKQTLREKDALDLLFLKELLKK